MEKKRRQNKTTFSEKVHPLLQKVKKPDIHFDVSKLKSLLAKIDLSDLKSKINKSGTWINVHVKKISWKSPKVISGALVVVLACGGLAVYLNTTAVAAYMYVNGNKIGIVSSPEKGEELINKVLAARAVSDDQTIKTHDEITYDSVRVKKSSLLEKDATETALKNQLSSYAEAYEIAVNDVSIALLSNKEEADRLLKEYEEYYTKPSDTNKVDMSQFEENVAAVPIETQPGEILAYQDAYNKLLQGNLATAPYEVQANDSWWLIARKNDMKTKEVLAGNPGMTEDSILKPGQVINIVKTTPYINVISKGVATVAEIIPFDVQTKTDYSLSSGKTVVKTEGSDGEKLVTFSYVQKNGVNVSKDIIEEQVTKKAVTQVVAKGPASFSVASSSSSYSRGSGVVGSITWPAASHTVNSYYGYRSGGFHTGVDFAGDTGDAYMAAASGTVISAGWNGSYGNSILIDHGNGVLTRYAHSSKLLVSEGAQVSQGQVIGLIGATGKATGPHLHFEIIINGSTVNPLNYLR